MKAHWYGLSGAVARRWVIRVALVTQVLLLGCWPSAGWSGNGTQVVAGESWPLVWLDEDGDCQDTDVEVLLSLSTGMVTWMSPDACEVNSGSWQSWGTGALVGFREAWVVPLITPELAVQRGAALWTRDQQIRFLNDRENLIVLDPQSATERGNRDVTEWQPSMTFACEYERRYRSVSARFGLSIPAPAQAALKQFKATCGKAAPPVEPYLQRLEKSTRK